jgi:uncharacterized protein YkwD
MRVRASLLISACLAMPPAHAGDCPPAPEAVVAAVNALRAQPRSCGARAWAAAPALRWQPLLADAAARHARDLAARDRLDHAGADGATLRQRLRAAGYAMRLSGENLAGGPETLDEVLAVWLASPAHCDNLMQAGFEEVGLACVAGPGRLQRYWVLELATPRSSPGRSP